MMFWLDGEHDTANHISSLAGDTLTVTLTNVVSNGVTFDAMLRVTGHDFVDGALGVGSKSLSQSSGGLGVDSGVLDFIAGTHNHINVLEAVVFHDVTISNEVGGSVVFNGFESLQLNDFTALESAVIGDQFKVEGVGSLTLPLSPHTLTVGGGPTGAFKVGNISSGFTATAVPEPSGALLSGMVLLPCIWIRRRKRRTD